MKAEKILDADIKSMKIASLPSRPTAPTAFGGAGLTATEVKEAFDKLPLYIVSRFNDLIEDIITEGKGGLAGSIPTGLGVGHTLSDLLADLGSGEAAEYIAVGEESLGEFCRRVDAELSEMLIRLEEIYGAIAAGSN